MRISLHVRVAAVAFCLGCLSHLAEGVTKPHVMSFGKWMTVKYMRGEDSENPVNLRVRPLYVDSRIKEFVVGTPHDVTDRLLVVRRAFRVNDALPGETNTVPRWKWEIGGWLLVDRVSGHVSQLVLPDFDFENSIASWYRDYVAYCGISNDGKKIYALVEQLGRRKPVLRKAIRENFGDNLDCLPTWQRQPARATFTIAGGQNRSKDKDQKFTYAVRGSIVDVVTQDSAKDDEDGSETD
jgi:hypothetical protein